MKACILYREDQSNKGERKVAEKYFPVVSSRLDCEGYNLVIPRYSALPFYRELETDLTKLRARMINSHLEHQYVANFDYYEDLKDVTPETWFRPVDVPKDSGPWVLKGRTNSRKFQWGTHMFAANWERLGEVYNELMNDPLIGQQDVIIRRYVELEKVEDSIAGPPFTNEWRFFFYKGIYLESGYYWSSADKEGKLDTKGGMLAHQIANRIKDQIPFVVIDIAKTAEGKWILIELNDGQMSGLSMCNPVNLYARLQYELGKEGYESPKET